MGKFSYASKKGPQKNERQAAPLRFLQKMIENGLKFFYFKYVFGPIWSSCVIRQNVSTFVYHF